jgi:hypothetical protein
VSGTVMYVGGSFTNIGSQERHHLAALDLDTGGLTPWNPDVSGTDSYIGALALQGDTIYVGGRFTNIAGQPRSNLAALESTSGNLLSWLPNPNNTVHALLVRKAAMYIGGDFTMINERHRLGIAEYDISNWRVYLPLVRQAESVGVHQRFARCIGLACNLGRALLQQPVHQV